VLRREEYAALHKKQAFAHRVAVSGLCVQACDATQPPHAKTRSLR
jgi:hypothetical protein